MATMNPFDLLVDDDNEDPNQLASAQRSAPALPSKKAPAPAAQPAKPAKLPSKPLPPAQAGGFCFLTCTLCLFVFFPLFCYLFRCEVRMMRFSICLLMILSSIRCLAFFGFVFISSSW